MMNRQGYTMTCGVSVGFGESIASNTKRSQIDVGRRLVRT